MTKAILFDFDGTLADSERANIEAGVRTFRGLGMPLTGEEEQYIIGKSSFDYVPHFLSVRNITDEAVHRSVIVGLGKTYDALWADVVALMPGAGEALAALKKQNRRLAIATSNRRSTIDKFFGIFGFADAFEVIVTAEDVSRRKPDPEAYMLAIQKLGIVPGEGIAVEDTAVGVAAAKAAGLRCIAVPNIHTRGNDFSSADHVISSLEYLLELV